MFQALLVDALFFSPSGNFKNQASIVVYLHLHKIDMLEYPKIHQRLDDHIPASTDAFASSTEGSTGLASQSVGQPWRAKWPTESDEGTSCLQMFVFVLEGF